jgi:hypothetical protein
MAKSMSSFRLDSDTLETINRLSAEAGISQADVIALAVERMAANPAEFKKIAGAYKRPARTAVRAK